MHGGVYCHKNFSAAGVQLELNPRVAEPPEARIQRLKSENPVVIFARAACCMCHVMRRLLFDVGVHPTVIELDDEEIKYLTSAAEGSAVPALFIGGRRVGGLESLVALHLGGGLVPRLVEIGAI